MTAIPGKPLWTRANHTHTSPDRSTHKSQYTQPDPGPPTHKENLPFFFTPFCVCVCGQTPQWALKGPTLFFLLGRLSTTPYNIEDTQKKGVSKKGTIIAPRVHDACSSGCWLVYQRNQWTRGEKFRIRKWRQIVNEMTNKLKPKPKIDDGSR